MIKYQTGRDYGTPQILEITLPAMPADELADVTVLFADAARGITGAVTLMALEANPSDIGRAVMREYDAGRYTLRSELAAECAAYFDAEQKRDIAEINTEIDALNEFIAMAATTGQMPEAAARVQSLKAELAEIAGAAWIAEAKAWAMDNYDKGADTLVECWDTSDYADLLATQGTEAAAWDMLKRLCSIWAERQADARSYREC